MNGNDAPPLSFLLHGSADAPPPECEIRAGPFTLVYQRGDLRYLRLGDHEVLRRIYAAIRDPNWGTVPGFLRNERIRTGPDSFHIRYTSEHRQDPIHFTWHADIRGSADGTVRFTFDGQAHSAFLRNRIGFCVLYPIKECAGVRCRAECQDGSIRELSFPTLVAARQPIPGFQDLAALSHAVPPDLWVEVRFRGETFETEDQRNWIDASFKTYGTPLHLPFPASVAAGTRIHQEIEVRLVTDSASSVDLPPPVFTSSQESEPVCVHVRVGADTPARFPELGLASASHGLPLGPTEASRVGQLGLSHLRVDVKLASPTWDNGLRIAARDALELGLPLELAVHLPPHLDAKGPDLDRLVLALRRARADLVRILILEDGQRTTPGAALSVARGPLSDLGTSLGAGTAADLYQLHLQPPPHQADFIAWSMNPQVHAFDLASLAETPEAAAHQVAAVAHAYKYKPLVVSPITLKPRFNAVATAPEAVRPGELPAEVDARQLSLFGAGWTLAMLGALAPTGVESLTFFETSGWRGVLETDLGSPQPDLFPSFPGCVFPVYHVFADMGPYAHARVVSAESSHPLRVATLALRGTRQLTVWCANLTGRPQSAKVTGLGASVEVRWLDETHVLQAMREPERYRLEPASARACVDGVLEIDLPPFALARITADEGAVRT